MYQSNSSSVWRFCLSAPVGVPQLSCSASCKALRAPRDSVRNLYRHNNEEMCFREAPCVCCHGLLSNLLAKILFNKFWYFLSLSGGAWSFVFNWCTFPQNLYKVSLQFLLFLSSSLYIFCFSFKFVWRIPLFWYLMVGSWLNPLFQWKAGWKILFCIYWHPKDNSRLSLKVTVYCDWTTLLY